MSPLTRYNERERNPLTLYSPTRPVPRPPQMIDPSPVLRPDAVMQPQQRRTGVQFRPQPGSRQGSMLAAHQAHVAEHGRKNAEGSRWGDLDGGSRGLGFLVNNPITRNLLEPLNLLGVPMRSFALANEELAKALPTPLQLLAPTTLLVDEDRVREDDRSNLEKLWDPTYGWGQNIRQIDTGIDGVDKWANRFTGFATDVALDPLTYVTFGAAPIARKGASATAGAAARAQRLSEAVPALREAGRYDDAMIANMRRAGQRGLHAADNELLGHLGLQAPGVRMKVPFRNAYTPALPGTEGLARGVNALTGGVRQRLNQSDRVRRFQNARTPAGLEQAMTTITGGSGGNRDFDLALTRVRYDNLRRQGEGIRGIGAPMVDRAMRQIRAEIDELGIDEFLRRTEDLTAPDTALNTLNRRMVELAKERGIDIPEIEHIGYVPHMLSNEFKDMLRDGSARSERFKSATGIITQDTLRDSGVLSARALKPRPGSTLRIDIDGKVVEITEGSIDEINTKVKQLFPDMKGSALETNPQTIMERYVEGLASDVGNRYARQRLIAEGNPWVSTIERELVGSREAVRPGQTASFADHDLVQGVRRSQLSEGTPERRAADQVANQENTRVAREAEDRLDTLINEPELGSASRREAVAEGLGEVIDEVRPPLQATARQQSGRIRALQNEIGRVRSSVRSIAQQKRRSRELARKTMNEMEAEIKDLGRKIGAAKRQAGRLTGRAQREYIGDLNRRMNALRDEIDDLTRVLGDGVFDEWDNLIRRRDEFLSELRAAQRQYDEVAESIFQSPPPRLRTPEEVEAWVARAEAQPTGPGGRPLPRDPARGLDGTPPDIDNTPWITARNRADEAERVLRESERTRARALRSPAAAQRRFDELAEAIENLDPTDPLGQVKAEQYLKALERAADDIATATANAKARRPELTANVRNARARAKRAREKFEAMEAPDSRPIEGPQSREALDAAAERLRQAERRANRTPVDEAFLSELGLTVDDARRMFPERFPRMPDVNYQDPAEAASAMGRRARAEADALRSISKRELFNKRRAELTAPDGRVQARYREAGEELSQTEADLGRALRGEGPIEDIGREIADDIVAPEELKRRMKQLQLDWMPEKMRQDIERLDAEMGGLRSTMRELLDDVEALAAERAKYQTASQAVRSETPSELLDIRTGDRNAAPRRSALTDVPDDVDLGSLQPMSKYIDEVEEMIRLNPDLSDVDLNRFEALIHTYRRQMQEASKRDLSARQTQDVLDAASKGEFIDVITAELRDGWRMMPEGDVVMATELADMLKNINRMKGEPTLLGSTMTAYTNFFKTYATLTPGFHVRNAISSIFMNASDGVTLRTQRRGMSEWLKYAKADDPLAYYQNLRRTNPQLADAFDAVFASGAGGRFFEKGFAESQAIGRTKLKEGIFRNRATILSQRVGQNYAEGPVRLSAALDAIEKGGTVDQAIARITRMHFDYSQVSNFDQHAKKLIPFWTFMSRNLPVQITQMFVKPARYVQYESFMRNFSIEPDEFVPDYILSAGGFDTGERTPALPGMAEGMPIFLQPDLMHSRLNEDLDKIESLLSWDNPGRVLADFNPAITAPMEYMFGQNLFTGRQYDENDWRPTSGIQDTLLTPLMALTGQARRGPEGDIYFQEKGEQLFRSLNPLLDRTSRLVPQASGGEGGDRQLESWARLMGAPIRTISDDQINAEKRRRYFDNRDAMELYLALTAQPGQ